MWSKTLQQQTREFLASYQVAAMKHFGDSRYGICIVENGKFIIRDRSSNDVWKYDSIEKLIEDGWVID